MRRFSRWMALGLLALLALLPAGLSVPPPTNSSQAHNVILFIGDGMGFSHVTATRIHAVGMQGTLTSSQRSALSNQLKSKADDWMLRADS